MAKARGKKEGPTPKRPKRPVARPIRMMVIPEPAPNTRSIIVYQGEGTVAMKGPGTTVLECGSCGVPLVEGMRVAQIRQLVFVCPKCGAHNETMA